MSCLCSRPADAGAKVRCTGSQPSTGTTRISVLPTQDSWGRDHQEADTQNGILDRKCTEKKGGQKQSWLYGNKMGVQFSNLKGHKKGKKPKGPASSCYEKLKWNKAVDKDNSVSRKNYSGVTSISEWRTICAGKLLQEKIIKMHCQWNRSPDLGTGSPISMGKLKTTAPCHVETWSFLVPCHSSYTQETDSGDNFVVC